MELALLILLFLLLSLVQRAAQRKRPGEQVRRRPRLPRPPRPEQPSGTRQTMRELFEEVRRSMEEADRRGRGELAEPPVEVLEPFESLEGEEVVEERESLEAPPRVESLEEQVVRRAERPVVDLDEAAEEIVRRRVQWAEQTSRGRTVADHRAFDARIRKEEAAPTAARSRAAELRKLVIWREVLGPPVSLRGDR
jgi:hypothetical protein